MSILINRKSKTKGEIIMKNLQITTAIIAMIFAIGISPEVMGQSLSGKEIIEKVYNRPAGDDQTVIGQVGADIEFLVYTGILVFSFTS